MGGAIGWLLIDEVGHATPQAAVGTLWGAQRAVVVGDPMQLEPIVTLPGSIEARLRERHGIGLQRLQVMLRCSVWRISSRWPAPTGETARPRGCGLGLR